MPSVNNLKEWENGARLTSRRIVARSAAWRLLEVSGSEALSFGFMVLLARILGPQDYGVVTPAALFVASAQALLTRGIPAAIVQQSGLQPTFLDTAFWANLLLGCILSLVMLIISEPIANLLDEPALGQVLIGLSPLPLICAAVGVYHAQLRRAMEFRSLAMRTQACVVVGGIVGTVFAFSGASFWSLVAQQLSYTLTNLVVLILASGWVPRWRLNMGELRHFYRFSCQTSGTALLETASNSGLPFLIGTQLSSDSVGLFFLARRVVLSLSMFTHSSINELSLPVLSRLFENRKKHRDAAYFCLRMASVITLPAFVGVAVFAEPLVSLIFGTVWLNSIETLQILVLAGVLQVLPSVAGQIFTSTGQPRHELQITAVTCFLVVTLVGVLASRGIAAAAVGVAVAYAVAVPLTLMRLRSAIGISLVRLTRDQAPIWIGVTMMALAMRIIGPHLANILPLAGQLAIELCCWAFGTGILILLSLSEARRWLSARLLSGIQ